MSEDIVQRLRNAAWINGSTGEEDEAPWEAAAEITRLRDELAKVIAMGTDIVDGRE